MNDFLKKINNIFNIKNVSRASIVLNLACMILGIIYLAVETYNIVWDIFGAILMITLFGNGLLIYLTSIKINRTTKLGNRINLLCYFYAFFMILAMLFLLLGNLLIQISYTNDIFSNIGRYAILFIGYFGILGFGMFIAYLDFKNLDNREIWDLQSKGSISQSETTLKTKKMLKTLLRIFCIWFLANGVLFVFIVFLGAPLGLGPYTQSDYTMDFTSGTFSITADMIGPGLGGFTGLIGCVIAEYAVFFSLMILGTTILYLKLVNKQRKPKIYYAIAIIGVTTSGLLLAPLITTPYHIIAAEQSFAAAFGDDWRNNIDSAIEQQYFLQSYFSFPGYFLGTRPKDCNVASDIKYFDGSISNFTEDADISLYFDAYWPKVNPSTLPGKGSVLIWIHGGGWMLGDKGNYRVHFNKYFAAQGYVVYDIQYGLIPLPVDIKGVIMTPDYVIGDFDINDLVRHIGNFTHYIANPSNLHSAASLGANINSTFIHGGSAGGHLTCASALGLASGLYPQYFNDSVKVKGYIPYYPGNGIPDMVSMGGDDKLINPEKLVDANSPPCLIYHGTSDGLAGPEISVIFKNAYTTATNTKCAIIWAPLAGHASDIHFGGHYNQVFTYFMERFMYLCVNDLI